MLSLRSLQSFRFHPSTLSSLFSRPAVIRGLQSLILVLLVGAVRSRLGAQWEGRHWWLLTWNLVAPFIYLFPFVSASYALFGRQVPLPEMRFAAACGTGVALASVLTYLIGRIGVLTPAVQLTLWCLFLVPEVAQRGLTLRHIGQVLWRDFFGAQPAHLITTCLLALILFACAQMWIYLPGPGATFPPLTFDLSLIHLTAVKTYLYNERIMNPWWLRGTFIPQLTHALYTGGCAFLANFGTRLDLMPNFFSTALTFAAIAGLSAIFKRARAWALAAGLLALAFPVARWHLSTAYLEPSVVCFVVLTFAAYTAFNRTGERRYFFLMCFFSSAAFSCKHFGAIMTLPIVVAGLFHSFKLKRSEPGGATYHLLKDAVTSLAVALPLLTVFYHYNWTLTGRPLFPFQFVEPNPFFWNSDDMKAFAGAIQHYTQNQTLWTWLTLPSQIAFGQDRYSDTVNFNVGPIWIALLLIGLVCHFVGGRANRSSMLAAALFTLSVQTVLWFKSSPVYRYLTPQLWMLAIYATLAVHNCRGRWRSAGSVALVIALTLGWRGFGFISGPPPPTTPDEYRAYLELNLPSFESLEALQAREGDRRDLIIYSLVDQGTWLFYPYPFMGDWFGANSYDEFMDKSAAELRRLYSERRITHLLANGFANGKLVESFMTKQGEFKKCFELTIQGGRFPDVKIYRLRREDPACFDATIAELPMVKDITTQFPYGKMNPLTAPAHL